MKIDCYTGYKMYVNGVQVKDYGYDIDANIGDEIQMKYFFMKSNIFKINEEGTIKVSTKNANFQKILFIAIMWSEIISLLTKTFQLEWIRYLTYLFYAVVFIFYRYYYFRLYLTVEKDYNVKFKPIINTMFTSNRYFYNVLKSNTQIDTIKDEGGIVYIEQPEDEIQVSSNLLHSKTLKVKSNEVYNVKYNYLNLAIMALSAIFIIVYRQTFNESINNMFNYNRNVTLVDYIILPVSIVVFVYFTLFAPELKIEKEGKLYEN